MAELGVTGGQVPVNLPLVGVGGGLPGDQNSVEDDRLSMTSSTPSASR